MTQIKLIVPVTATLDVPDNIELTADELELCSAFIEHHMDGMMECKLHWTGTKVLMMFSTVMKLTAPVFIKDQSLAKR